MLVVRRVRTWALLAAVCVAAVLLPAPATSGGSRPTGQHGLSDVPWSAAQRVTDGTAPVPLAAAPDGSTWGVTRLPAEYAVVPPPSQLVLLRRDSSGAWTRRPLPVRGFPLGVADDGRSTHVLYRDVVCGSTRDGCRLLLLSVPHGGAPSAPRELERGYVVGASLAADGRGWWAAWTVTTFRPANRTTANEVRQARSGAPTPVGLVPPTLHGLGPAQIALRGDGAVVSVVRQTGPLDVVVDVWSVGATGAAARVAALRQRVGAYEVDVAVSAGRTSVVLWDADRLVLAQDRGDLRFRSRVVPTPTDPRALPPVLPRGWLVAASAGVVSIAYDICAAPDGERLTCRTWVAQVRRSGSLRTTEVSAPVRSPDGRPLAVLGGLASVGGRAVVAFESPFFDSFVGPTATSGIHVRTSG